MSGTRGGLGYFGLSYFEANQSRLNDVAVDAGSGCVKPSKASVRDQTYKPLSRGLYIYAKRDSFKRAAVRSFIGYALNNQLQIANKARFVPLTVSQAKRSRFHYNTVSGRSVSAASAGEQTLPAAALYDRGRWEPFREAFQAQVEAIRRHAPEVGADADPEELHELRVAIRRMRALLRAAQLITDERAGVDPSRTPRARRLDRPRP